MIFVDLLVQWGSAVMDLLFPRRCLACGKALEGKQRHLCPECFEDLPLTFFWQWAGNPAEVRMRHFVGIEAAASLFFYRYESAYHNITPAIKYRGEVHLGFRMGRMLGEFLKGSGRFGEVRLIVPVPLHPVRRWRRGYNQAEVIARGISSAMDIPVSTKLLERRRSTSSQTHLRGESKRRNLKGAFIINKVEAQRLRTEGIDHILITDDVLTSGATLEASTSVLLPYFRVSVATLGYVE